MLQKFAFFIFLNFLAGNSINSQNNSDEQIREDCVFVEYLLAKDWVLRNESKADNYIVESWFPVSSGLKGYNREYEFGQLIFEERFQIKNSDGKTFLLITIDERETKFEQIACSEKEMVFENPEHDFPQRIKYKKIDEDYLFVEASAIGKKSIRLGLTAEAKSLKTLDEDEVKLKPILKPINSDEGFRGISMGEESLWASGTNGTVIRSTDLGESWQQFKIPNCDSIDFRDVHALNDQTALILSAGSPALIYRTEDVGLNWELVYENDRPEIFMDGMDFFDDKNGMAYGDPIDGKFVILKTEDAGLNWTELPSSAVPSALAEEAGFAASGTGIKCLSGGFVRIATGNGSKARILASNDYGASWWSEETDIISSSGCGIFSIDYIDQANALAVGGCYESPDFKENVSSVFQDGSWSLLQAGPNGYRSAVRFVDDTTAIAVGRNGVDVGVRNPQGWEWISISEEPFYAIECSNRRAFVIGKAGRFAVISF